MQNYKNVLNYHFEVLKKMYFCSIRPPPTPSKGGYEKRADLPLSPLKGDRN